MDATGLLAPILVLTTVVERIMETLWSSYERIKVLAWETLIRNGHNQAEKDKLARDPDYVRKLLLDDPAYKERKRLLTLVVGSAMGIVLSVVTGVNFFAMTFAALQIPQPVVVLGRTNLVSLFDTLITGVIIGAGSQPAHALINWVYWAQSVQKELSELRSGEKTLGESQLLNEVMTSMGIPQDTIVQVMRLMDQHGVRTLDDLLGALRSAGSETTQAQIAAVENLKALKNYLAMTGRGNLTRLLP